MLDWLSSVLISAVFRKITTINHLSLPNSCRTMTIDSTFTKKVLSMARIHLMQDDELEPHVLKTAKALEASGADTSTLRGLANRQDLFDSYFQFYGPARKGTTIGEALIELVRLKIARHNDCFT
jgi:hypothetical protein